MAGKLYDPVAFNLQVDEQLLSDTKAKLKLARYPQQDLSSDNQDWSQGTRLAELKRVAEYWMNDYSWEEEETAINDLLKQFTVNVEVDGYGPLQLHYVHEVSDRKDAIPLLFSHGWPGSFLEIRKVIKDLAHPDSPSDPAFHVVVPSIPGFGPGPAPTKLGMGPRKVAQAFDAIMHKVLGYQKYVLQGGDFGSFITRSMAIQFPARVRAQHLNMFPVNPPTFRQPIAFIRYQFSSIFYSEWEKQSLAVRQNFEIDQSGYLEQQKTRPQTLGVALGDSPLGLLAWFLEKFHDWVDETNYKLTDKEVITFVMMHWIQGATPGLRFYNEAFYRSRDTESSFETYVPQPTGVSMYPKEQLHCPRDWATRVANIQFWREHSKGGHFSTVECPDQYLKDIRSFFGGHTVQEALRN